MTGSAAIDVVLGLVFVYLLYSLLCSILVEFAAKWLRLRQRMLVRAISRMLDDSKQKSTGLAFLDFIITLFHDLGFFFSPYRERPMVKEFYNHPNIKYLGQDSYNTKPSYLSASSFSLTLIDILRGPSYDGTQSQGNLIKSSLVKSNSFGPETLRQLRLLFNESKGDVDKFRLLLENWFNEMMQRCSGWFKKQSQIISFLAGLLVACSFNVDTIAIAKILANDPQARQEMSALAVAAAPKYKDIVQHIKDSIAGEYDNVNVSALTKSDALNRATEQVSGDINKASYILSLGERNPKCDKCDSLKKNKATEEQLVAWNNRYHCYQSADTKELGWLLTAIAISLGAPFWFDLLSKIVAIRSSIKPESDSGDPAASPASAAVATVSPNNRVG